VSMRGGRAWWVAPTYKMAHVGWRLALDIARQIPATRVEKQDRRITFPSGGVFEVRSADRPDTLRGEGLHFLVMDEAAFTRPEAWDALRPSLADTGGRALLISTPNGHNWFYEEYQKAVQGIPGYSAWRFPTATNPFIPPVEIEHARLQLPDRVFRQEYLAEFLAEGIVFEGYLACVDEDLRGVTPRPDHVYVAGIDWGKYQDYTAVVILNVSLDPPAVVYLERMQGKYTVQAERLNAILTRWNVRVALAEANMSEAAVELLQDRNLPVRRFQMTPAKKATLIERLAVAFEQRTIAIPDDPVLKGELGTFRVEPTKTGIPRYSAMPGFHDDTVIALALAWEAQRYAQLTVHTVDENPFYAEGG